VIRGFEEKKWGFLSRETSRGANRARVRGRRDDERGNDFARDRFDVAATTSRCNVRYEAADLHNVRRGMKERERERESERIPRERLCASGSSRRQKASRKSILYSRDFRAFERVSSLPQITWDLRIFSRRQCRLIFPIPRSAEYLTAQSN